MAVRRGPRDLLPRDHPGRAGAVLHHHAPPDLLRELLAEEAAEQVRGAAGREGVQEADVLRRGKLSCACAGKVAAAEPAAASVAAEPPGQA